MANILDIVKEVEKMNVPRPYSNDPDISQFLHGAHKEYTEGKKGQIRDMQKSILDVFEEKSQDADTAMEYGMGLSTEELLDIAMSVTPMGGVKAGKGAISFLKGLLGRAKSKSKFPVGYGEPTKESISKLGLSDEAIGLRNLLLSPKTKPKGMRQFGKFNRQKWEK